MKRISKIVLLLLTICQLAGCLSACRKDENIPEEPAFELTKEQLAAYTIVIPYNADSALTAAATGLQKQIERAIGATLPVKKEPPAGVSVDAEVEYEILMGYINRDACVDFYADLKQDDTGYALVGKKLLILGYTGSVVSRSVIQFRANVLEKISTLDVLLKAGDSSVTGGSYSYETLLINGTDIKNYQIVYPKAGNREENKIASYLRDWIAERTGHLIPCVDDSAASAEYEIQIGDTAHVTDAMKAQRSADGFGNGKYYMGVSENTLWLTGVDRSGIYLAFGKLTEMIAAKDRSLSLELPASLCNAVSKLDVSVMNYNVYYDLGEKKRDPNGVIDSIRERNPDVFGLNEAGADWLAKIDKAFGSVYGDAKGQPVDTASDASYNPIYYKKDKFELVESGTKWLSDTPDRMSKYPDAKHYKTLTYAILKDKATGAQFMYINTHLDGSNEADAHSALKEVRKKQVKVLLQFTARYVTLPIVVAGDFNEGTGSAVVASMSGGDRFRYCASIAEQKTILGTTDVNSEFNALGSSVFDYVFVTSDSVSVRKYEEWDNKTNGKYPSDHLPVCAEVTILR